MTAAVIEDVCRARARLIRYRALQTQYSAELNLNGLSLLRHAQFEAFLTLRSAGLAAEARAILAAGR